MTRTAVRPSRNEVEPPPPPLPIEPLNAVPDFELVRSYLNGQLTAEDEAQAVEMRKKLDMFEYIANGLDSGLRQITTVNIYRLSPEITNQGPPFHLKTKAPTSAIEIVPADEFSLPWVREKIGGGKFLFWAKSKQSRVEYKTEAELPWPARIYPHHKLVNAGDAKFCVMVDADNKPLQPAAPTPPPQPITKEDLGPLVREVAAASKVGNDGTAALVQANTDLMMSTAKQAIQMVTDIRGNSNGDSAAIAALQGQVNELKSLLVSEDRRRLEDEIKRLEARLNDKTAAPQGELGTLSAAATTLNVEGGLAGLLKLAFGGGAGPASEPRGTMEEIGLELAKGAADFLRGIPGSRVVDWLQQNSHIRYIQTVTERQKAGFMDIPGETATQGQQPRQTAPVPRAPHLVQRTHPQPGQEQHQSAPADPAQPQEEQVKEVIEQLKVAVPQTIRYYKDNGLDGGSVATIVKASFAPYLGLMRMQFKSLEDTIAAAEQSEFLKPIMQDADFQEFANDFYTEMQRENVIPK